MRRAALTIVERMNRCASCAHWHGGPTMGVCGKTALGTAGHHKCNATVTVSGKVKRAWERKNDVPGDDRNGPCESPHEAQAFPSVAGLF